MVATRLNGTNVEIVFSDTGQGIPGEHIHKIFDPFFTTKDAFKGTGLGLAVSYGIIKKHGGEIEVASEIGKGTTFTVRLPIHG
jgi:signal transduction histidine kinase